ncbi:MAG: gamma-glutamyltransferase [Balneolaceae bacterium]
MRMSFFTSRVVLVTLFTPVFTLPTRFTPVLLAGMFLLASTDPLHSQVASESLRPPVMGKQGVVASAHPLASLAGQKMLADGGNAIDAIVAAAAALNAVEPYMSGVGGVGYMLLYSAEEDRVRSLIFGGWVPETFEPASLEGASTYSDGAGHGTLEAIGPMTAAVPGNLAGWNRALQDYGTLSLDTVLQPAITYAEQGVPITEFDQAMWAGTRNRVHAYPSSRRVFLNEKEEPYRMGEIFANPDLARTLKEIADNGADHFYHGELATTIADNFARDGGYITREDLASVPDRVQWTDPLEIDYRGYTIYNHPPPGMGLQQLQTLRIMEGFDLQAMGHNSADYLAHLMEAIALARADSDRHIGDPAFVNVPTEELLSDDYIDGQQDEVRRIVEERHAQMQSPVPSLDPTELDARYTYATTSLSAADSQGNVVVITQSLGGGFGSGYVAGDTGIAFNNAMEWMQMEPGHASSSEPGKGITWCIGAMMQVHKDGKPLLAVGSPGSFGILQSVPQIAMNILDFDMEIQEAIDAPRFRWKDELGSVPATEVIMESRIPVSVRVRLSRMGYKLDTSVGDWSMSVGGAQAVLLDPDSDWILGGADPRRNGYALSW